MFNNKSSINEQIQTYATIFKLPAIKNSFSSIVDEAAKNNLSYTQFLLKLFYPKSQDKNQFFLMNLAFYAILFLQLLVLLTFLSCLIINSYCSLSYTSIGHLKSKV